MLPDRPKLGIWITETVSGTYSCRSYPFGNTGHHLDGVWHTLIPGLDKLFLTFVISLSLKKKSNFFSIQLILENCKSSCWEYCTSARFQRALQERQTRVPNWEMMEERGNGRSELTERWGWEKPGPRLKIRQRKFKVNILEKEEVGNWE